MSDLPAVHASTPRRTPQRRLWGLVVAVAAAAATIAVVVALTAPPPAEQAQKSPDIVALAGPLASQGMQWEECDFTDAPPAADVDLSNVECSTIQVPRDWHEPDAGATWDIRVSRAANVDVADTNAVTLLLHPGGPFSGLSFAATTQHGTPQLQPTTNYISFDQRGLGQSSTAECAYEYEPSGGTAAAAQAAGEACSSDPDLNTFTSEQIAYDMDLIRHLLGADKVSYLGYSYGTWLGKWFGTLFAENIDRIVLDSVTDGSSTTYQKSYTSQDLAIDRHFRMHTMNWLARNDAIYELGDDPEEIWERYFAAHDSAEADEAAYLVWTATGAVSAFNKNVLYPIVGEVVVRLIADGEADAGGTAKARALRVIDSMSAEVLPDSARAAAQATVEVSTAAPEINSETGLAAATMSSAQDFLRCADGEWSQGVSYWDDYNSTTAQEAPLAAQLQRLDAPPVCAFWPTEVHMPEAIDSFPATIVVQSELDALTPWEQGRSLAESLPNVASIIVDNESVHGVFPYGSAEVDDPISDFLRGGMLAERMIVADAKPLPLEQATFESWAPLDQDGHHGDPVSDPTTPAGMSPQ